MESTVETSKPQVVPADVSTETPSSSTAAGQITEDIANGYR